MIDKTFALLTWRGTVVPTRSMWLKTANNTQHEEIRNMSAQLNMKIYKIVWQYDCEIVATKFCFLQNFTVDKIYSTVCAEGLTESAGF